MLTIRADLFSPEPWPFALLHHNAHELGPRPDWRDIAGTAGPNKRVDWSVARLLSDSRVESGWREAAAAWTSPAAWSRFYLPLFAAAIRKDYPEVEGRIGRRLDDWRVGRRFIDKDVDVFLDFQIGVNTPTGDTASSVRGPHIDSPTELIGGLLYMREADDTAGGDIRVWVVENPRYVGKAELAPECVGRPIAQVPYRHDSGIAFLNTTRSVHDITVRQATDKPRLLVSFCAEMATPLFVMPR